MFCRLSSGSVSRTGEDYEPFIADDESRGKIQSALAAIAKFREDLDNPPGKEKMSCTQVLSDGALPCAGTIGFLSFFVSLIAIPTVVAARNSGSGLNSFSSFEGKAALAVADRMRDYIVANKDESWAQKFINSDAYARGEFANLTDFTQRLIISCAFYSDLMAPYAVPLELKASSSISSALPGAAVGFIAAGSALGIGGTVLLELIGWHSPGLSLSECRLVWKHLSTLKQYKEFVENPENATEMLEGGGAEIDKDQLDKAMQKGKSMLWSQLGLRVRNLSYVVGWAALGLSFYELALAAEGVPDHLIGDYPFNTFERYFKADDNCIPGSFNATFVDTPSGDRFPFPGAVQDQHNATISYPDQAYHDDARGAYLGAVLQGLAAPGVALLCKLPSAVKISFACIRTNIFGWTEKTSECVEESEAAGRTEDKLGGEEKV